MSPNSDGIRESAAFHDHEDKDESHHRLRGMQRAASEHLELRSITASGKSLFSKFRRAQAPQRNQNRPSIPSWAGSTRSTKERGSMV